MILTDKSHSQADDSDDEIKQISSKQCHLYDHVLSQRFADNGSAIYYSGVILETDTQNNQFLIMFDDEDLSNEKVLHSLVYPCSSVSYDYKSSQLPPSCLLHCDPR